MSRAPDNFTLAVEGPDLNARRQDGLNFREAGLDALHNLPTI